MLKKIFLLLLVFCQLAMFAQNVVGDKFEYSYRQQRFSSDMAVCKNSSIQAYYDSLKLIYDREMGAVLGEASNDLKLYTPQSPLSNLLTDIVFEYCDSVSRSVLNAPLDMSLLNFGGIRSDISKGPLTVGNIYSVLSFDNLLVIATLKGRELQKVFNRFTAKNNQPYSHAKVVYRGENPVEILVNGQKIDPDKMYRVATLDFLVFCGGDGVFDGVVFDSFYETNCLFRQVLLEYVAKKKVNDAGLDERVVIKPQP